MSAIAADQELHVVRLAVHEAEDLADMLRTAGRAAGNARRYNQAMSGARWFEKKIAGRNRLEPLDLIMAGRDWDKLANLCSRTGLTELARRIWTQLEMGD